MSNDIVTRLRDAADAEAARCDASPCDCQCPNLIDAADEIERLRAAGDALAVAHADDLCDCDLSECVAIRAAHDAWQEARRG